MPGWARGLGLLKKVPLLPLLGVGEKQEWLWLEEGTRKVSP